MGESAATHSSTSKLRTGELPQKQGAYKGEEAWSGAGKATGHGRTLYARALGIPDRDVEALHGRPGDKEAALNEIAQAICPADIYL